jgi:YceI-like domain
VKRKRLLIAVGAAAVGLVLLGILGAASYAAAQRKAAAFSLKTKAAPPRLTATPSATPVGLQSACPARTSIRRGDDLWLVGTGTQAGFRARETFMEVVPLPHEAVARTDQVAGSLEIRRTDASQVSIQNGCFAVELNSLTSIDTLPGRSAQDRDQIYPDALDTASFPFAILTLNPATIPLFGSRAQQLKLGGELTIKGNTRPVAITVDAQTMSGTVHAVGSMPIDAHDFGVRLPGEGDPIVVDPHLILEFLLVLEPAPATGTAD